MLGEAREHFLGALEREWPEELERYRRLYPAAGSGYLRSVDLEPLEARVAAVTRGARIDDRRRIVLSPPSEPQQLALGV